MRKRPFGENRTDNIAAMFLTTSAALTFTELSAVFAILVDGIVTSRFLGVEVYSAVSLMNPFSGLLLVLAGFLSTGCIVACSRMVGTGKKEDANRVFSLSVLISLLIGGILIAVCLLLPKMVIRLCGVSLNKYPELIPHMSGYLGGLSIGIPFLILTQITGPVIMIDNGKRIFAVSSAVLCVTDIVGDLLNVFVFHGGAFGMGAATSFSYFMQFLVVQLYFIRPGGYFRVGFGSLSVEHLIEIARNGTPALTKKLAGTVKDVLINYIIIMIALSTAAIAARGIQSDLLAFVICVPAGLGKALITMTALYFSANDRNGLKRLYSYAFKTGFLASGVLSALLIVFAPFLARIYTSDAEVLGLAVFSIRWMSVALVFDTGIMLIQHYLQGIGEVRIVNRLSILERLIVPVVCALVLGLLFGSKGILASMAVSNMILLLSLIIAQSVRIGKIPHRWSDGMYLPAGFGGEQSDNLYAEIRTKEDVIRASEQTRAFCLAHDTGERSAFLMSLFVEEMGINILEHAERKQQKTPRVDFRLFLSSNTILISLTDLGDHFDPTAFYNLHRTDDPKAHLGIRMVTEMAKDVRYYSTFSSNNLVITLDREQKTG